MRTSRATSFTLEPQSVAHAPEMLRVLSDPAIYEFENEPPSSEQWLAETAVLRELRVAYGVNVFVAVLKGVKHRSLALLSRLGFAPASRELAVAFGPEPDDMVMVHADAAA